MPSSCPVVQAVRPADAHHQVLTVVTGKQDSALQHRPCACCPWRKDAVGEFPPEAFRHSARTAYDLAQTAFGCQAAGSAAPRTCAGFLLSDSADHSLLVRLQRMRRGGLEGVDAGGLDLFPTYREMAEANGVSPDDPVLAPCR
jgi:hypothetical protein